MLAQEQPHLLNMPKSYNGIHPKTAMDNIIKNSCKVKTKPITLINIPSRDLQNYDSLIPSMTTIIPPLAYAGAPLWN